MIGMGGASATPPFSGRKVRWVRRPMHAKQATNRALHNISALWLSVSNKGHALFLPSLEFLESPSRLVTSELMAVDELG